VTCTRKEDGARIVKNHHTPTIKNIPDKLWDEIRIFSPTNGFPTTENNII
jgi:hypothetical protein